MKKNYTSTGGLKERIILKQVDNLINKENNTKTIIILIRWQSIVEYITDDTEI